jgi:transposase
MDNDKDINRIVGNFRYYDQSQPYWDTIYINKLLEEDHPARIIDLVVERLDITNFYQKYSDEGNPAYNPKMMLKLLFYGYLCGIMSCRKLWDAVMYRADFIFLAAGAVPNFRTINSFRLRHLGDLPELFAQIVFLCSELGMVGFEYLAIDGEKIHANASFKKNKDLKGLKMEYEKTQRGLAKLLEKEPTEDFPDKLKRERQTKVEQKLKDLEEMKNRLEEFKKDEEKKNENKKDRKDGGKRRKEDDPDKVKLNMTDEDARPMPYKDQKILPSYNHQSAVDGKYGVVCAVQTTQRPDCQDDLFPLVDMANANTTKRFKNVIADCGFGGFEVYEKTENEMSEREENFLIPDKRSQAQKEGKLTKRGFAQEYFKQDEEGNYICPMGYVMQEKKRTKRLDHMVDIYLGTGCAECEAHAECTKGKVKRITIDTRAVYQKKMRDKLDSDKGREIYRKRQGIVEPVHGDDQKNQGWIQHHLCGLFKAAAEFYLVRIGTNLKKIVKYGAQQILEGI